MDKERKHMNRCPFCGSGERRLFVVPWSDDYDNPCGWYVLCAESDCGCGACGPTAATKEDAIDAWNGKLMEWETDAEVEEINE